MQYFYRISACDILTLLSKGSKRRVFQQLTSQQIIEKVIAENNAKQNVSFFAFKLGDSARILLPIR